MTKNHFIMHKLDTTEKVRTPNGRIFYEKFERLKVNALPQNIRIQTKYTASKKRRSDRKKKCIKLIR